MNQKSQNRATTQRVAFLQARWHADIVDQCRLSFVEEWRKRNPHNAEVDVFDVPGAFELPLLAKRLARNGQHEAIICCAFVVNGGIYRHDFVSSTVVQALMQVQLETDVPVLSAVLTPHNFHETDEHRTFFREHFRVKGREAADACAAVLHLGSNAKLAA